MNSLPHRWTAVFVRRLPRPSSVAYLGLGVCIAACSASTPGDGGGAAGRASDDASSPPESAGGVGGAGGGSGSGGSIGGDGGNSGTSTSGSGGSSGNAQGGAAGVTSSGGSDAGEAEMPPNTPDGGTLEASTDARAASDAPISSGGCTGLFCEDFEKGAFDPAVWDVKVSAEAAPVIQTTGGVHGKFARFHGGTGVGYAMIITKTGPAGLVGHHYGRASFRISPNAPPKHTEFLYAGTKGFPKYKYLEVASVGAPWQLTYVNLAGATTEEDYHSGGSTTRATWNCLEWEFNDTPDQASVSVDGKLDFAWKNFVSKQTGGSTGLVGGFTAFGFGFYAWHGADVAFDVDYDDIVLDTKPVGCPAR